MHYEKYIQYGCGWIYSRSTDLGDDRQASLVLDFRTKIWGGTALSSD